ncbi:MAG TPA: winged helix-turn-helix domain-containing protein [Ilumatobacteraceae bacterium]|nr:winged helix-turn-helix domain-containing protein [Ilumatobacteraceae bacterium]
MASRESVISAKTRIPRVRALRRDRIDALLRRIRDVRATLVVAPAGSGKTTALAQFAMVTDATTIWLRTDPLDGSVERFVAHLDHGWARALDLEVAGWVTIDDAIHGFEAVDDRPIVVVIDDLHEIRGRPAEAAVARLIVDAPDHIGLAIGTRTMPSFDVTRLRLSGELLEIGPDDLRFRTWEAERLLDEVCGLRLSPEDVARLTQRIEGWAAGFQLFHLAVRHKPPAEQRRLIGVASSRSSLARQYLTRNVLDALPDDLRSFLLDTSVLGVVNGALADKLLARDGSDAELWQLEELEQFVMPLDDGTYRYHEVLRSHLETELGHLVGPTALTERFALAAPLLEDAGYESEALRCHARAGHWGDVSRLAGSATAEPFARSFEWLDLLPSSVADDDPWLVLARARASLAAGKFRSAIEHYQRASRLFGDSADGDSCRRERLDIESFLDPFAAEPAGWLGELRRGLRIDPRGAAQRLDRLDLAQGAVAAGLLHFATGHVEDARRSFDRAVLHDPAPSWTLAAARLGRALCDVARDGVTAEVIEEMDFLADSLDSEWLARLARIVVAGIDRRGGGDRVRQIADRCELDGDPWGRMLCGLSAGLSRLASGMPAADELERTADIARQHGASLIEVVALTALAAADADRVAPRMLRSPHVPDLRTHPLIARLEQLRATTAGDDDRRATDGVDVPIENVAVAGVPIDDDRWAGDRIDRPDVAVRCLGGFELVVDGRHVDLNALRPRARAVLHLLATHAPRPVHRDILLAALWSDNDADSALRSLQVSVSSVRKQLERAGWVRCVERVGDGYALIVGPNDIADVRAFRRAVDDARRAHGSGDHHRLAAAARHALDWYRGDLLTEQGSVDWVVEARDALRLAAGATARLAATAAFERDDMAEALTMAQRGLQLDRFDDTMWNIVIGAHTARGESGAAARARQTYDSILDELGLVTSSSGTPTR